MRNRDSVLTRSGLARATGVHKETIRFYEQKGLLKQPSRSASGYRLYDVRTVHDIQFIKRAQDLGFTLAEIGDLLTLRSSPETSSREVRNRTRQKITLIDQKIRDLRSMRNTLLKLTQACDGESPLSACPIIAAMEGEHP